MLLDQERVLTAPRRICFGRLDSLTPPGGPSTVSRLRTTRRSGIGGTDSPRRVAHSLHTLLAAYEFEVLACVFGICLKANHLVAALVLKRAEFPALDASCADTDVCGKLALVHAETPAGLADFLSREEAKFLPVSFVQFRAEGAGFFKRNLPGATFVADIDSSKKGEVYPAQFLSHVNGTSFDVSGAAFKTLHDFILEPLVRAFRGLFFVMPCNAWWSEYSLQRGRASSRRTLRYISHPKYFCEWDLHRYQLIIDPVVNNKPTVFPGQSGVIERSFRGVRVGARLALSPGLPPCRGLPHTSHLMVSFDTNFDKSRF